MAFKVNFFSIYGVSNEENTVIYLSNFITKNMMAK